jgi:parvulin-like peptidyl-prolyl isomerase
LRRWLREPLLHFLLLGAVLFALDRALRPSTVEAGEQEITVSAGRVESLAALFAKTWQRAPTPGELRDLVHEHVLEEALYREALALGLDRDDAVVRRRLRQKLEFVVEDVSELDEPSAADLEAWLEEHRRDYASPATYHFRQVYVSPERRGPGDPGVDAAADVAERLLDELRAGAIEDPSTAGDATLLPHASAGLDEDEVARVFGEGFARRLSALEPGAWAGPVESAYGLHLVRVDAVAPGSEPELADVRAAVERDWRAARREEALERHHAELLERYRVTIEWPGAIE